MPNGNENGADSFTFKANDSAADSAAPTVSITISAVNDAPSFTTGADQTTNEGAGAQTVSGWANAISAGPADEATQTVSFTTTNGDAWSHPNAKPDCHPDADSRANSHSESDRDPESDCHPDTNTHAGADCNANANTNPVPKYLHPRTRRHG